MNTLTNRISASVFNFFIEDQYIRLQSKLIGENRYIADVYHQTWIDVSDEMKFDLEPTLRKAGELFERFYKQNTSKYNQEKMQYKLFDGSVMDFIISNKIND